jgi:pSer/pThr/pTyr-binding forkhead associated (FHA) protein
MIRLEVIQGEENGRVFDCDQPKITIGRSPSVTVSLTDYHLSSEHGLIFQEGDRLMAAIGGRPPCRTATVYC